MSHLIESFQICNGSIVNSGYHQERMVASSQAIYGRELNFSLNSLKIPEESMNGIVKCRIIYSTQVETIQFDPYIPRKIGKLKLVIDNSISYSHKFEDRSTINDLLKLKGKADSR